MFFRNERVITRLRPPNSAFCLRFECLTHLGLRPGGWVNVVGIGPILGLPLGFAFDRNAAHKQIPGLSHCYFVSQFYELPM